MKIVMSLMAIGALAPVSSFASMSPYELQAFLGDYQLAQTVKGDCNPQLSIAYTSFSEKDGDEGVLSVGDVQFAGIGQGWLESTDRSGNSVRSESEAYKEFITGRPTLKNHTERYLRSERVEERETEVRATRDGRVEVETEMHGRSCGDHESKCLYVKAVSECPDFGKGQGQGQGQYQGQGQGQGQGQIQCPGQDQGPGQVQAPDQDKDQGQDQGQDQGKDQGQYQGQDQGKDQGQYQGQDQGKEQGQGPQQGQGQGPYQK